MTDTREPADGGYVAVKTVKGFHVLRRIDEWAPDFHGKNWFYRTASTEGGLASLTWAEVTDLGPVDYVGEIVDRRAEFEGEPWPSL